MIAVIFYDYIIVYQIIQIFLRKKIIFFDSKTLYIKFHEKHLISFGRIKNRRKPFYYKGLRRQSNRVKFLYRPALLAEERE